MFRLTCSFAIVGLLLIAGCSTASTDTSADLTAISALRDAYAVAFTAEDAAKTASTFAPDGILMEDNAPAVRGRDAIRAHYEKMMAGMETDIQLKSEETVVNGDWAFDRGQTWLHVMSKDPKSTMPMIMDQGKYVAILKKQSDGAWLVSKVIANSNIGPPPPAPAPTPATTPAAK
jgi:uncharacterized protein (TIGR02246 family)